MSGSVPRLCIVSFFTHRSAGGAEKQFFLLADYLNARSLGSTVIVGGRIPDARNPPDDGATKVIQLLLTPWIRGLRRFVAVPFYLSRLCMWLMRNRKRYDCILVGAFDVSLVAVALAAKITRRPFVVRYAGLNDADKLRETVVGRLGVRLLRRARSYVVNSELVADHIMRDLRLDRGMITHIPNAYAPSVTTASRHETRRQLGLRGDLRVYINVSSFYSGKNQSGIIKEWPRIRQNAPSALLLVGDGPCIETCRAGIDSQWRDEIRFLGRRDDVAILLKAADVFLFPSIYPEGLSNALMEAMASGLPCVVSDIPQNRALVDDGVHGLLFDAEAPHALSNAVAKLHRLEGTARLLGLNARERILAEYGWEKAGALHLAVLRKVVACG